VTDVVDLTKEMCLISSITNDEHEIIMFVKDWLEPRGYDVKLQAVGGSDSRFNLLATRPDHKPEILLTTHLDTVPPYIAPYESDDGEWLWGRGVCDAKGIAAAMMVAGDKLIGLGEERFALLFVVGEETCSDGAKTAVNDFAPSVKYFIDGEPTDMKLVSAMKGAMQFDLEVVGKAGHSAYPESGHSAVHQLVHDVEKLLVEPWPNDGGVGDTNLNVGKIEGGVAPNVHAPHAKARCMMRTATDVEVLEERLRSLLSEKTQVSINSQSSPLRLHVLEGKESCVVSFGSDVPYLLPLGTPLLVGPGSILDAHTDHEKVKKSDLHDAVALYADLVINLLEDTQ